MNLNLSLKKNTKAKPKPLPPKHYLNLAGYNKKKMNPVRTTLVIILLALAIFAFAKFLVFDRFDELSRAQAEAASLQAQLDANYAKIKEMDGLADEYAHFTFSGMTEDELSLVSRVDVMDMINRLIVPYANVSSWTLQGNTLAMTIDNTTLARANQIVSSLGQEPIVNYSFVQTAATDNSRELLPGSEVTAQITVYLQIPPTGETGQTEGTEGTEEVTE